MGADDRGLGRGLILLLFGPPGVGKSFTAEAGKSTMGSNLGGARRSRVIS